MKPSSHAYTRALRRLFSVVLLAALPGFAQAQVFTTDPLRNTVGEYNPDGTAINTSLISGLNSPWAIAVSGFDIFVVNRADETAGSGSIGVFKTSGQTVNASLISGLSNPVGFAVSGSVIFVTNTLTGQIEEFNATTGAPINAFSALLIPFPDDFLTGVAVSGTNIFVARGAGSVGNTRSPARRSIRR